LVHGSASIVFLGELKNPERKRESFLAARFTIISFLIPLPATIR